MNFKTGWGHKEHNLVSSVPSRNEGLTITTKNYEEADIRVLCSRTLLLDFFTLGHILSGIVDD